MTPTLGRPPRETASADRSTPDWLALAVRVGLACAGVGIAGYYAFLLAFWAVVTYTGCFMGCNEEPNASGGIAYAIGAAATLACGPLAVAALFRSRAWIRAAVAVFVLCSVLGGGALLVGNPG